MGKGVLEVGEFGGGDEEGVAVGFEFAASAGGAAEGFAGGDVGVGVGEDLGDGGGEGFGVGGHECMIAAGIEPLKHRGIGSLGRVGATFAGFLGRLSRSWGVLRGGWGAGGAVWAWGVGKPRCTHPAEGVGFGKVRFSRKIIKILKSFGVPLWRELKRGEWCTLLRK